MPAWKRALVEKKRERDAELKEKAERRKAAATEGRKQAKEEEAKIPAWKRALMEKKKEREAVEKTWLEEEQMLSEEVEHPAQRALKEREETERKMEELRRSVDEVKAVMRMNIEKVCERGEKLEDVELKGLGGDFEPPIVLDTGMFSVKVSTTPLPPSLPPSLPPPPPSTPSPPPSTLSYTYMYIYLYIQAGLAGEDAPTAEFPTLVGRPRHQVQQILQLNIFIKGAEGIM